MAIFIKRNGDWQNVFNPIKKQIYGVRIERANADIKKRVTYTDDAVGMAPVIGVSDMGSWVANPLVEDIKPVLRKFDGSWQDLDKRNLANGAGLTTLGNDVLVQFRTWWLSITGNTQYIYIRFANYKADDTYHKYASTYKGKDVGCFHAGAFHSFISGNRAYSVNGKTPTGNLSGEQHTQYAQARGEGFDELNWHQLTYIVCLTYVLFKGTYKGGLGAGSSASSPISESVPKYNNDLGMNSNNLSFLWLNNIWDNLITMIAGVYVENGHLMIQTDNEPSKYSGTGFQDCGVISNGSGCLADIQGTSTISGLAPTRYVGNTNYDTYFQCSASSNSRNLIWGGNFVDNPATIRGPSSFRFVRGSNVKAVQDGGRLVYRAGRPGVKAL